MTFSLFSNRRLLIVEKIHDTDLNDMVPLCFYDTLLPLKYSVMMPRGNLSASPRSCAGTTKYQNALHRHVVA